MSPPAPALPPALSERYRALRLLGQGGFGTVYEVERRADGQRLALKTFPVNSDHARIRRELQAATELEHPHVITAYAGGLVGDHAFLEMEVADGSLRELYAAAHAGDAEARRRAWAYLPEVADGLAALAERGWAHRDLKPENVLLVEGVAKITDLGLARGRELATLTATGIILGTPRYMAPEQAKGQRATPATDVFAWAAMVVELLEGTVPWDASQPLKTVMRLGQGDLSPWPKTRTSLTAGQQKFLAACLSVAPEDRPSQLGACATALGSLPAPAALPSPASTLPVSGNALAAPQVGLETPSGIPLSPSLSWPLRLTAGGFFLALLCAGFLHSQGPPPRRPAPAPSPGSAPTPSLPLDQLSRELERADFLFVDKAGKRYGEADRPPGAQSLTDGDPGRWGELVEEAPTLGQMLSELWSTPWDQPVSEARRDEWAAADRMFAGRALSPPFGGLLSERGDAGATPPLALATALLDELEARYLARAEALDRCLAGAANCTAPELLLRHVRALHNLLPGNAPRFLRHPRSFWTHPEARKASARWMGTTPLVQRLLRILPLALREASPESELFSARAHRSISLHGAAFGVAPLDLPPYRYIFPGAPEAMSPGTALVAGQLVKLHRSFRFFGLEPEGLSTHGIAAYFRRGLEHLPGLSAAAQLERRRNALGALLGEYLDTDRLAEAQRALAAAGSAPHPVDGPHHLAHKGFDLLTRLAEVPEQLLAGPDRARLRAIFAHCNPGTHPDPATDKLHSRLPSLRRVLED